MSTMFYQIWSCFTKFCLYDVSFLTVRHVCFLSLFFSHAYSMEQDFCFVVPTFVWGILCILGILLYFKFALNHDVGEDPNDPLLLVPFIWVPVETMIVVMFINSLYGVSDMRVCPFHDDKRFSLF